jgi:ADP-heptose:LPS heptosyltransferase
MPTVEAHRKRMALTGERRDEVARILETAVKDGLPGPRDLDAALDAIEQAYLHTSNDDN